MSDSGNFVLSTFGFVHCLDSAVAFLLKHYSIVSCTSTNYKRDPIQRDDRLNKSGSRLGIVYSE